MKKIKNIKNEVQKVKAIYNIFDEDSRLRDKSGNVEFLTTVKYIEKHLKPGMKILDIGAGTGIYSLYLAEKGYDVTAVELVDKHVNFIESKKTDHMNLKIYQGNALDLSKFDEEEFDMVLSFGPLYHLLSEEDKLKSIDQAKRVSKDDAYIYFAFISHDMIFMTETFSYDDMSFLKGDTYNRESLQLDNFPFVFHTLDEAKDLINKSGLKTQAIINTDGFSELLGESINKMDEETYQLYLNYHFYICEKPEFLGSGNHLLFITKKYI